MSSGPVPIEDGPDIPHLDKILHFLYYAGGGTGLHLAFHYRRRGSTLPWPRISIVVLVIALVGWFDEWHQSWIPERSGNDPYDWLADVVGGFAAYWIHRPIANYVDQKAKAS